MIHVDRNRVSPPRFLNSSIAKAAFEKAKLFYEIPPAQRLQRRHKFESRIYKNKEVQLTLSKLFNDKCAYCESKLGPANRGEIDQFRPKAGSYDIKTQLSLDHYWWLAYDWRNFYLVCQVCNANKGSKFPLNNQRVKVPRGDLAKHNAPWFWQELSHEQPLLLDPCSERIVLGDHLVFDKRGVVGARTREGRITIQTLKLNRDRLVHERKNAIEETIHQLELVAAAYAESRVDKFRNQVKLLLSPAKTYLAARRGCVKDWVRRRFSPETTIYKQILKLIDVDGGAAARISAAAEATIVDRSVVEQTKKEKARATLGKLEAQYITRIELNNFRAIESLEIDMSSPRENYTPWLVLLGENGMGKSSILKAVALALMDPEYCQRLNIDASSFVRHGRRSGYVRVHTTAHTKPFELSFSRNRKSFAKTNDNRLQTLLLGYGGTRLLPRGRHRPPSFRGYTRIEGLFDPFLPLLSAESWLFSLDRQAFGYSARVIKDLLTLDNETKVVRRDRTVKIKSEFNPEGVRLEDLSDGYQSMVALSADIMRLLMKGWELAEKANGIVLLDEIDVHLHPRWKMEVTSSLRRCFPRVQFMVTTHDPLCLNGTKDGEVRVLSRNGDQSQIGSTGVDVPPGATADQLLTGFWFGLSSTIDSETLDLIDEHRGLLTGKQTPTRVRRRLYIEDELRRRLGVYADTSLDRMAQSVAAQLMSSRQSLTPRDRQLLREQLVRQLSTNKKNQR